MTIPLSEKFNDYAQNVFDTLNKNAIRTQIDLRAEKIGYKIREATLKKIPYLIIIGEQEVTNNQISVRSHENFMTTVDEFIKQFEIVN